ncbi:hypothetical protein AYK24_05520 [Thermoplasmatales archaeon SG8-52-4]|nr:MAG: hypothetical protein AYK24_05520 [Thermoplasmatales archaeon SG8-52-4]
MKKVKKKSKQKTLAIVALIVVVLLVASSVLGYYIYYKEEEKPVVKNEIEVVDNRISPLENQGLIVEILRIRHRGLYDRLMTWYSNSWKNKPTFIYELTMDGLTAKSTDVVSGGVFKSWDTMFQESKMLRDADEEQETSTIVIKIIERVTVKSGLLKKTTKEVEKEKITVTYDYRTGRWTGDDYFRDYDGYGHYRGNTFEVWFNIYQNDFDTDYIPYWTEVNVLGTDPMRDDSDKDPDGDGIPTTWEWKWGYDPFTWDDHEMLDPDIDGLENIEEYKTSRWLSDPYHQDIYCEVDHMPDRTLWPECIQAVIEKYAEHNINIYFDDGWPDTPNNGGGELLPKADLSQDSGKVLQFYNHNFPDERKGSFRYVIMYYASGFNHPAKGNIYDVMVIGYKNKIKDILKAWLVYKIPPTGRGQRIKVASTLMHELGHSVGISPWTFEGCDNISFYSSKQAEAKYDKTWGQYYSVLNYYTIYDTNLLDYSHGKNGPPYDQNDWLNLFVASFQYPAELIEEIYFEPPGFDKVIYGETETGITGYSYDAELTERIIRYMGEWSPVDPIKANWIVFKLEDKDINPDYKDIKIMVQPDVPYAGWAEYAEGELDSEGNFKIYSQQEIINELYLQL